MSTNMSILSSILLALVFVLSSTQGQHLGEKCTAVDFGPRTPGMCKRLRDCPVVYDELVAGREPSQGCGFQGFEPIVCCPSGNVTPKPTTTTTPEPTTTTTSRPLIFDRNVKGSLARAMCQENSKAAWTLEIPHTLIADKEPVNKSLCTDDSSKLIVGGEKAEPKEFPYMVALGYDSGNQGVKWICGGTLISKKVVLTAAHCLDSEWGPVKWARVGDLNLVRTDDDAQPQTIEIAEIISHPGYKAPVQYHDVAILKLVQEVEYNAWVRAACLPVDLPDEGYDNKAVATGWGRVDWSDEEGSESLQKVTLNLVPHRTCNPFLSDRSTASKLPRGIVNEWQICAGEPGKDTCQGDSGGPLAIYNSNYKCMFNVIGITSFGVVCGEFIPGIYTRVYNYVSWIERTAWPEYFDINYGG